MFKTTIVTLFFLGTISAFGQNLQNRLDTVSYALGVMMVDNMKRQNIDTFNLQALVAALEAEYSEKAVLLNKNQAMSILNDYFTYKKKNQEKELKEKQENFLLKNKEREEVVVLESGLQYEVLEPGIDSLDSPSATDRVIAHYEGKLIDGTVFDSSYSRGEPLSLKVNGVIKGWQEALQLMKPGAKWKLYIPYNLAYGERGSRGAIPPYATLIFTLELISLDN